MDDMEWIETQAPTASAPEVSAQQRAARLAAQQATLVACERRFGETIRQYRKLLEHIAVQPQEVVHQSAAIVTRFVNDVQAGPEVALRLLSQAAGDKTALHPVNVTVLALLLGRLLDLPTAQLLELGQAALLHDMGKPQLPERVRWPEDNFSTAEFKQYQEHVALGVALGQRLGLSEAVLALIAQHHEWSDGSGFPARLRGEAITLGARILALANHYDNLCNPIHASLVLTPHEALQHLQAQPVPRLDAKVLSAFGRMLGPYPPGSVVQLSNGHYALVVSVHAERPQQPGIIVYEPGSAKDQALVQELGQLPGVSIRCGLKPTALPGDALDFLAPRQCICHFFDAVDGA